MTSGDRADSALVAVAIPCLNEADAIAVVVAAWREALPEAEVVVFDNGSTDGTGAIARKLGVRVVDVPARGKGNAVRAIFRELVDRPAVILTDGDGTYPASAARGLLDPVLADRADMTVGARRPVRADRAMSLAHAIGNRAITGAFALLVGRGCRDLLSGYRVFGPRFLRVVEPRSSGFEIEAELTGEAIGRGLRVVEVPVSYHPRIAGTASKLRAVQDGCRIGGAILAQSLRHRPWRPAFLVAAFLGLVGWGVGSTSIVLAAATVVVLGVVPLAWAAARPSPR